MEVILLDKLDNLGELGDRVKVKNGYGRNYLIPYGKAKPATAANIRYFEERRAEIERQAAERLAEAQRRADQLSGLTVTVTAKAGEDGKLFGSVGAADVAQAVSDAGVTVTRQEVRLPNGAFRSTGEQAAELRLHSDVHATVMVAVTAES